MPSATYRLFRQAILGRTQILCVYKGRRRAICPHVLGHTDGQEMALTYQFAGDSNSGLLKGGEWRCLALAEVVDARRRQGAWHSRANTQPQTCVQDVDVSVDG